MYWIIGIKEIEPRTELSLSLDKIGCTLFKPDHLPDGALDGCILGLRHAEFDSLPDFEGVKAAWDVLKTHIGYAAKVASIGRIAIDEQVYLKCSNGKIVTLHAIRKPRYSNVVSVSWRMPPKAGMTKEEIAAYRAEHDSSKIAAYVSRALKNENARLVLLLQSEGLTPLSMYHIVDLIQDDMNGDMSSLTSKKELTRFQHSMNTPQLYGTKSRHIAGNNSPPSKPMSIDSAQRYVAEMVESWLGLPDRSLNSRS
jgi:hypothetical protein